MDDEELRSFDPYGFSNYTCNILRGLGQPALIPICREKNMSAELLQELTEEDLIHLGVDAEKVATVKADLEVLKTYSDLKNLTLAERILDFPQIIKNASDHLLLLHAHTAYARLRLLEDPNDFVLNPDKGITSVDSLDDTVTAALVEMDELVQAVSTFEDLLLKGNSKKDNQVVSYRRHIYAFLGGAMLMTLLWLRLNVK